MNTTTTTEVAKAFNQFQCSCGNVFSMEDYPKNLRNHIQSNEQQGRCPTCMAERAAKKRKRETYLCGACTSEITDVSQYTDSQIKEYKKGRGKILCKKCTKEGRTAEHPHLYNCSVCKKQFGKKRFPDAKNFARNAVGGNLKCHKCAG